MCNTKKNKEEIINPPARLPEDCLHREQGASSHGGSSLPPPSPSHTAYPATFGTSFSLLGFSHLGHWHKINEDTKKTQGSALEGVGGWGVKLSGCKIALAAVLLFQHFMGSCSGRRPYPCLFDAFFPSFFFFFYFCFAAHTIPAPLRRGCNFIKYSYNQSASTCASFLWFGFHELSSKVNSRVSSSWWERERRADLRSHTFNLS